MIPRLSVRGGYVVATAALMVLAGALGDTPALVALATVVVASLGTAYVAFFPAAILLRRKKFELAWWVPPGEQAGGALTVDHPFALHIALRNHGHALLRVLTLRVFAHSALEICESQAAHVPAGLEVEVLLPMRARTCGQFVLHGALATVGDLLGLFEVMAYFPSPIGIKVFPAHARRALRVASRPQAGALHERMGTHPVLRRGMAGDLREIREHAHGDPFKFIAWKATARRRKLMVRELESEIVLTHQILVDIAGSLRAGRPGETKLDYAIQTAARLAGAALDGGDRVGLCTFDTRVVNHVKPDEGHPHVLQILDRLVECQNLVDEDLIDLTDSELVAAVARYLLFQEAKDLRLYTAPPAEDAAWHQIAVGPKGELYDMPTLLKVVTSLLPARHLAAAARSPLLALRTFCLVRGIELPYRKTHQEGRRAQGLYEALTRVAHGERAQRIVILSDLVGLAEAPAKALGAFALVRRRGHSIRVVVPAGMAFQGAALTETGRQVSELMLEREEGTIDLCRARLAAHGVPVITAGPDDTSLWLGRRTGHARRRGAG